MAWLRILLLALPGVQPREAGGAAPGTRRVE